MDYALAKQLKDAGFSYNQKRLHLSEANRPGGYDKAYKPSLNELLSADYEYVPTLEELIEACGEQLEAITHEQSKLGNRWIASAFHITAHGCGDTPTIAVAQLWLALQSAKSVPNRPAKTC